MSDPRNNPIGYLVHPDAYACRAARPAGQVDERALIVARVHARAEARPALLLPLVGGWLLAVMCLQLVLQPAVVAVLWPLPCVGIGVCAIGWGALRRGRLTARQAWMLVSVTSWIQAITFVLAFFLTELYAYQTAAVIVLLAVSVLDVRGRAMQLIALVVITTWLVAAAVVPGNTANTWDLLVIMGACSAGLVAHLVTMRSSYTVEWLRVANERRADALADALTASHSELRLRQRAERKLTRALDDLQAAQAHLLQAHKLEAIGQLAAGVAHEINTPTQYVSDNTTFLQTAFDKLLVAVGACRTVVTAASGPEADAARTALTAARVDYHVKHVPRAIEQSLEGLRRIASLVAALKEFSHPSAGVKSPCSLNETIQMTLAVARNEWKYVAEMATDLDEAMPAVWCLRDELSQVVLNLVVNAAHAIGERSDRGGEAGALGRIQVRTRRDGAHAVIEIEDDGAGIPDSLRHRIFEPFFTTKPVGKGTGQGLAISYNVIVDKHGGSLDVESEVGVGTTFTIRIPIEASPNVDLVAHLPAA
jgi:signal transduction histidine kinase